MLLNSDTVLSSPSSSAVLVPYSAAHVSVYHAWMQNATLLELTASEPLSLSEEHDNMNSWRNDPSKLTFIILDSSLGPSFMAGDVNLYLLDAESEGLGEKNTAIAEVEVMVAETQSRRKGIATDALRLIMAYARLHLKVDIFVAKVLDSNAPSLKLFEHGLGFQVYRRVKAFGEVHMKMQVHVDLDKKLADVRETWHKASYKESPYSTAPVQNKTNEENAR